MWCAGGEFEATSGHGGSGVLRPKIVVVVVLWVPTGGPGCLRGRASGPGQQPAGQFDDDAPDAVLVEPVQRQPMQSAVLAVRMVFAAGPARYRSSSAATTRWWCWWRMRSGSQSVVVGEPQPRTGMGPLCAHDDPHTCRPGGQSSIPVASHPRPSRLGPIGVVSGVQTCGSRRSIVSGQQSSPKTH